MPVLQARDSVHQARHRPCLPPRPLLQPGLGLLPHTLIPHAHTYSTHTHTHAHTHTGESSEEGLEAELDMERGGMWPDDGSEPGAYYIAPNTLSAEDEPVSIVCPSCLSVRVLCVSVCVCARVCLRASEHACARARACYVVRVLAPPPFLLGDKQRPL